MALILPDFKDRRCLELDVCGHIPDEVWQDDKPKEIKSALISHYTLSPGREIYLGLVMPFPGNKMHVHLRLAVPEKFKEPPELNSTPEEILKAIEPCLGKKVNVGLDGLFRVPLTELSPLIRSTLVETSADKVQVRM